MKFSIHYKGKEIELERLPNGKFKKPEIINQLPGAYSFNLKPAVEVIVVSMKPLSEKTYIDQALKNRKGITWLDDGRIPFDSKGDFEEAQRIAGNFKGKSFNTGVYQSNVNNSFVRGDYPPQKGRFPANLLVSDNVLDTGLKQSIGHNPNIKTTGFGKFGGGTSERVDWKEDNYIKDSGDFSRYFSLDEWWRVNFEKLPKEQQKIFPFLYVPKASKTERNTGLGKLSEKPVDFDSQTRVNKETADKYGAERKAHMQNHHPTVKPIKLMSYLITLTTRQGDIVLDPFIGSGTTAISSLLLNRNFIGFEKEIDYFKIASERVNHYRQQTKLTNKEV